MFEMFRSTLQLMKHHEHFKKLHHVVDKSLIDGDIRKALSCLERYWRNYPDHDVVEPSAFLAELNLLYPDMDQAQQMIFQGMVHQMMQEPDATTTKGLIRSYRTLDFATKLEKAYDTYQEGHDIDLHAAVRDLIGRFEADISRDESIDWCQDTIDQIIHDAQEGFNFPWFLDCLGGSLPDVRAGDQLVFAARPGKGKTSFCARAAVHVAPRTPDDRPVVWFNNESKASKIKGTVYRAALGKSFQEIIRLGGEHAQELFEDTVGGRGRIKIFDVHGRDYRFLESIIQQHQPSVVFFDMLDNVRGFGDAARTDLRLEQLYQWARERAVIDDFVSIATSQISVEGRALHGATRAC